MNADFAGADWADGVVTDMGCDVPDPKCVHAKLRSVAASESLPGTFGGGIEGVTHICRAMEQIVGSGVGR